MNSYIRTKIINKFQLEQETLQWLNAITNVAQPVEISAINQFIKQCKQDGNWYLLDRFWLFAQSDQTNAKRSIINPTSTVITEVNSPSWTAYQGYTGNGTTSYLDSNWNPSTNGVNYTLNSASLGVYSRTDTNGTKVDMGVRVVNDLALMYSKFTDNKFYYYVNSGTGDASVAVFNSLGLFSWKRTASNSIQGFQNGVSASTGSIASTAVPNANVYICCQNFAGATTFSNRQYSLAFVGSGTIDHPKLYNAIQTMLTQLGCVV